MLTLNGNINYNRSKFYVDCRFNKNANISIVLSTIFSLLKFLYTFNCRYKWNTSEIYSKLKMSLSYQFRLKLKCKVLMLNIISFHVYYFIRCPYEQALLTFPCRWNIMSSLWQIHSNIAKDSENFPNYNFTVWCKCKLLAFVWNSLQHFIIILRLYIPIYLITNSLH